MVSKRKFGALVIGMLGALSAASALAAPSVQATATMEVTWATTWNFGQPGQQAPVVTFVPGQVPSGMGTSTLWEDRRLAEEQGNSK